MAECDNVSQRQNRMAHYHTTTPLIHMMKTTPEQQIQIQQLKSQIQQLKLSLLNHYSDNNLPLPKNIFQFTPPFPPTNRTSPGRGCVGLQGDLQVILAMRGEGVRPLLGEDVQVIMVLRGDLWEKKGI